jgi:uncharacterized membrane protein YhaH (DUF805 family)
MFWRGYGRINRPTYFMGLAIVALFWGISMMFALKIPGEVFALLIAVPRLHDIGRSGWWAGAAVLVELVVAIGGLTVAAAAGAQIWASLIILGVVTAYWVLLIWLGCIPGQAQTNSYGDPPPPGVSFKTYRVQQA